MRSLFEENQSLLCTLQATSSELDVVQQEHALSRTHENSMYEWKLQATNLGEELARTRQELEVAQGAECELTKCAKHSIILRSNWRIV